MTDIHQKYPTRGARDSEHHPDTSLWSLREGERLPKLFWAILGGLLSLTLIFNLIVHIHGYFGFDGVIGFYAVFGFISCLAMVVVAKILGFFLKKPEDYYGADEREHDV